MILILSVDGQDLALSVQVQDGNANQIMLARMVLHQAIEKAFYAVDIEAEWVMLGQTVKDLLPEVEITLEDSIHKIMSDVSIRNDG